MMSEGSEFSISRLMTGRVFLGILLGLSLMGADGIAMNNTRESLAEFIPTQVYQHTETAKVLDFRVDVSREKIQDPRNLVSLVSALVGCLTAVGKEALCGARPEETEVYFDQQGTNAHLFLNRALEVGFFNKIDFNDVLVKIFEVKSERTQKLALQGINKLKKSQWLSIGEKILPELEVLYYVKILEDRDLGRAFRAQTKAKFHKVIGRSLYDADQLLKLKGALSGARITDSDLRFVCRNADRKDVLFRSIKLKLGIEKVCGNI
jgi:hypothetical protein